MVQVIVIPELENSNTHDDYKFSVSYESEIWINPNLGTPQLIERNVRYVAPYWITSDPAKRGVNRLYHIIRNDNGNIIETFPTAHVILLGNSFIIPLWNNVNQFRRFEYHPLQSFNMRELENQEGILLATT